MTVTLYYSVYFVTYSKKVLLIYRQPLKNMLLGIHFTHLFCCYFITTFTIPKTFGIY